MLTYGWPSELGAQSHSAQTGIPAPLLLVVAETNLRRCYWNL